MSHAAGFPAIIDSSIFGTDPHAWAAANYTSIEDTLTHIGAILLRGTGLDTPEKLEAFAGLTSSEIPDFKEESSPRSVVEGRVLTSTDYPSRYPIQFHNEYSYAGYWPMKLYFGCFLAPQTGGETPISDTRRVLSNMRPSTRDAFERKGVLYVRNYRPDIGVSWQAAFATEERSIVERICAQREIEYEWRPDGILRTRQIGEAILAHPRTRELVWFNHGFFFNARAIEPPSLREVQLEYPDDDPLSTNTLFGDGTPIGADIIEELRSLYQSASSSTRWQEGDLLLIDNMLTAHSRAPFQGKRRIVVLMADSCSRQQARLQSPIGDGRPAHNHFNIEKH